MQESKSDLFRKVPSELSYRLKNKFLWNHYYNRLRQPKTQGSVTCTSTLTDEITAQLEQNRFKVKGYRVDVEDYKKYLKKADYPGFRRYYRGGKDKNFPEKSLEHYLAAKFLKLSPEDIYIDIASATSPTPEIYERLYGCDVYRQDILYPIGVHGKVIGGDASNLPLSDSFATKIALHCSFEHFEHDSDVRFIREASRVLKSKGRLCILPLYLFKEYAIQTNPVCVPGGFRFEENARLYCVRDWQVSHSRFYDVPHLIERVGTNLEQLDLTIYVVENEKEVDPSCYVKHIAVFEKK